MQNEKVISYELKSGEINYNINNKKINLVCDGLAFKNHDIKLILLNDGTLTNSLDIKIEKESVSKYRIISPTNSESELNILYYYLDDDNRREYVHKGLVSMNLEKELTYEGHKVKTYYKSENGYIITEDYKNFLNSDMYLEKDDNILKLEQEILDIEKTIDDITFQKSEYSKINDEIYKNYLNACKEYENLQIKQLVKQTNMNNALKDKYESYYSCKDSYYNYTKKELGLADGIIEDPSNIDDLCTSYSIEQYLYKSTNGRNMEINNLKGFYYDRHPVTNYYNSTENVTPFENLTPSYKKAKYYEQLFKYNLDSYTEKINEYSNLIEKISWGYQKKINNLAKKIKNIKINIKEKEAIYEAKYNPIQEEYYNSSITRFEKIIEFYKKTLVIKKEELGILKRQTPVLFLIKENSKTIYGINEYNKISNIFDINGKRIDITYNEDNKIKAIKDENKEYVIFEYNSKNRLIRVKNDLGEVIRIEYGIDKPTIINLGSDQLKIEYRNNLLYRVIDSNKIGFEFIYNDLNLEKVYKISSENHLKEIHNYTYEDNTVTLIDKTKYIISDNLVIYSKYQYVIDSNSVILEIEFKNNEIINIIGYEHQKEHCSFKFTTSKDDEVIYKNGNISFTGVKTYDVELPNVMEIDYTLYAIINACSVDNINEYRKTAYCNHQTKESNIKYEVRINLEYSNEVITYGSSLNPNIKGTQVIAIPVLLKEDTEGMAIIPDSITIDVDYSFNNGICNIIDLSLTNSKYQQIEYSNINMPEAIYYSDIKYPIFNDGDKTGYVIKKCHQEYSYNLEELLEEEKMITNYLEYDLSNTLIDKKDQITYKKYYYDNNKRVIKTIDSNKNILLLEYDDNGNIIKNISYNEENPANIVIRENEYDDNGDFSSETNDLGYKIKYKNSINELIKETPNGFITNISSSYIKTDLLSHSLYENGIYESYSNGNMNYRFEYDEWGYEKDLFINDTHYMTFIYKEYLGNKYYLSKYNDNSGYLKVTDLYDKILYIKKINNETDELLISYNYDSNDNLISLKDGNNNIIELYEYIDNVLSKITNNNNYIKKYSNDIYGNITSVSYDNDTYNYIYNEDKNITTLSHNGFNEELKYDSLKRIISKNNNIINESYEYLNVNNRSTNYVKIHKQSINNKVVYNKFYYDECGNIIKSIINHNEVRYYYDGLNRLIRLDSSELNHTYTYSFDDRNNIISKGIHDLSNNNILTNSIYVDYEYDNDNKLISYDNNEISYDTSLRPINYKGNTLLWDNNQLIQFGNNHYEYDYNGLRIKKITSNEEIEYIRDGSNLLKELHTSYSSSIIDNSSIINNSSAILCNEYEIIYNYGINGIEGFTLNNKNYHYIKNIFNDVIEVIDEEYNVYAKYSYDVYGKCFIIINENGIADINPIRYRSYYYDKETELYYLNNRYYDPDTMRFISMDDISYLDYQVLGGLNLFTYCNNNPITNIDPNGNTFISAMIIGTIVGAVIGAGVSVLTQGMFNGFDNINVWQVLVDGAIGAISGLVATSGLGAFASGLISGGLGFLGSVTSDIISSNGKIEDINWGKAAILGIANFFVGMFVGGAGSQNSKAIAKGLLKNEEIDKTFRILYNATNKYLAGNLTNRGYAGVFNIYCKQFLELASKSVPNIIIGLTTKNLAKLAGSSLFFSLVLPAIMKMVGDYKWSA